MFLIRFVRKLFAAPLWILAAVASFFSPPLAAGLYRFIWLMTGDGRAGQLSLMKRVQAHAVELARLEGRVMMDKRPSGEIAAFAGMVEMDLGDVEQAESYLQAAQQAGGDREGLTELLQCRIVGGRDESGRQIDELISQLAERRDLSPLVSKFIIENLMWRNLFRRRFDEAQEMADRLLAVESNPQAEVVRGVLYQVAGMDPLAEGCFTRAAVMTSSERLYAHCLATAAVGWQDQAHQLLAELREQNEDLADRARRVMAQTPSEL